MIRRVQRSLTGVGARSFNESPGRRCLRSALLGADIARLMSTWSGVSRVCSKGHTKRARSDRTYLTSTQRTRASAARSQRELVTSLDAAAKRAGAAAGG